MKFNYCFSKRLFSPVSSILAGLYLCVSISGCQSGDEIVSLEQRNPDDFLVLFSDTSTVKLSTVAFDSTMTGGASRMLAGRFEDPYLGKMHSTVFFQPTLENVFTLPEKAVYDSLVLKLAYDKYYYGDTTKTLNFSVHTLQEDILTKSVYFNNNTTPFDATPIGTKSFKPTPNATNSLRIKLSDVIGKKVFNESAANLLTNNDQWINIVKGLMVVSGTKDNASVVGFKTGTGAPSDSTVVELHYHTDVKDGITRGVGTFNIKADYNQIGADRSGTDLTKLPTSNRISLPSAQSGEKVFIQAGVGLMARADFPTVRNLKDVKYSVPNRAFLRVTPYKNSIVKGIFGAPPTVYVYLCDKNNQLYTQSGAVVPLLDLAGKAVTGTYINDLVTNKEYYLFDVSAQFTTILASSSSETNGLLFVTDPLNSGTYPEHPSFSQSHTRLVIGSQQNTVEPGVKLELYYTTLRP